jgi:hypothetical protein
VAFEGRGINMYGAHFAIDFNICEVLMNNQSALENRLKRSLLRKTDKQKDVNKE